jgi:hypothetical protein
MDLAAPVTLEKKSHKLHRRWFQFSLRTLLLLMLVFGCGLGWVAYERTKNGKVQVDVGNSCTGWGSGVCQLAGCLR